MTDSSRSLTIDLGPIGLRSHRENLDGLTRKFSAPRAEDEEVLIGEALSLLNEQLTVFEQNSMALYKGKVPMYDYLLSLKANKNDKIGQKVRLFDFWSAAPEEFRPVEGDSFSKLYSLREFLKNEIECYQDPEVKHELRRLNDVLSKFSYDVRIVEDGHYQVDLSTFIHESWVADTSFASYMKPEDKPSLPSIGRWGDLCSSDEDDLIASAVRSLTKPKESANPGIVLPLDFDTCFPMLGRRIEKLCNHYQWEKRLDRTVEIRRQGLVPFRENSNGIIECSLDNNERLALLSLYACVGAMFLKPQTLAREDNTEVALTFVCSAIAREQLAVGVDKDLVNIALKNGDGGRTVFSNRLLFLTKSGDSAMKMIFKALDKLVSKFARELKDDQLDEETSRAITDRAFTSVEGMLGNCYRKSKIDIHENRAVPGRKGRAPVKVGEKTIVSPPDLKTSRVPLKPSELTRINSLSQRFNDRKSEVEKRVSKVANPTIFTTPLVCKEVVAEAYRKLAPLKVILKSRTTKIRDIATKANNGAKPGPGDWATAMTQVLNDTSEISEEVYAFFNWEE